jgi:hypothetical protein
MAVDFILNLDLVDLSEGGIHHLAIENQTVCALWKAGRIIVAAESAWSADEVGNASAPVFWWA